MLACVHVCMRAYDVRMFVRGVVCDINVRCSCLSLHFLVRDDAQHDSDFLDEYIVVNIACNWSNL